MRTINFLEFGLFSNWKAFKKKKKLQNDVQIYKDEWK